MARRDGYTPLDKPTRGSSRGGGGSTLEQALVSYFTPIIVGMTFVIVLVSAIVLGIRSADTQSKVSAFAPTITTLPISDSCSNDTKAESRRAKAYQVRVNNAFAQYALAVPCHINNGDEALYSSTHFSSFSKGLPHDALGHVNASAYALLLKAINSGLPSDFDAIPLASGAVVKLTNPQSGLAFVNEGGDSHSFHIPPAPTFASAQQAAEIVENYWMALLRDIPFAAYPANSLAIQAAYSIGNLSDYRGPKPVTPETLFRGNASGCLEGPYLSQFFYKPCVFGANTIDQRMYPPTSGVDFMTNWSTYLGQQNAQTPEAAITYGVTLRHMINGRDLSHWVHIDVLLSEFLLVFTRMFSYCFHSQAYFQSMLCLLNMNAPLKAGIPYQTSALNQMGFGTFGGPHIAQMATNTAVTSLKSVWMQKWFVHRRLRPEVFAARIDRHKNNFTSYPIHTEVLTNDVLPLIYSAFNSYLLPMAFPEGSPLHPSYGAGHATVAAASVTVLKALFDEEYVITNPVMPNAGDGGATVVPLSPAVDLTVGGELDKVAYNVAIGRNIAGVHWRSDADASMRLGEQVAISILRDMKTTFSEPFSGWSFTSFDGVLVTV